MRGGISGGRTPVRRIWLLGAWLAARERPTRGSEVLRATYPPLGQDTCSVVGGLPRDTLWMLRSQLPPVTTGGRSLVYVVIAQLFGISPQAVSRLLKPRRRRPPGRPPLSVRVEGRPRPNWGGGWLLADPLRSPLRNAIRMAIANAVEGGGVVQGVLAIYGTVGFGRCAS